MDRIKKLNVSYNGRKVGTMALYKNRFGAFEYDKDWISDGFSISPFSLPLEQKAFIPKLVPFDGVFGVFADSLPDGWGRLYLHITEMTILRIFRSCIMKTKDVGYYHRHMI